MKKLFCILLLILAALFAMGTANAAENADTSIALSKKIDSLLAEIKKNGADEAKKHDDYCTLARLLMLSGDVEGSADAWAEAANAIINGKRDDAAILEMASCLIALGEWERARENVQNVLITGKESNLTKARYLAALIELFKNNDGRMLHALANESEYSALKPAIYESLWKVSGDNDAKNKLLTECPESPEALSIDNKFAKNNVEDAGSAQWFFGTASPVIETVAETVSEPVAETVTVAPAEIILQTGLFSSYQNALSQQKALKKAGFDSLVEEHENSASGKKYWLVLASGTVRDSELQSIKALKDAGFDAFPVKEKK